MEQLTLFSSKESRQMGGLRNKRTRKSEGSTARWDLWTQEVEAERAMALFFLDIRNFTPLVEKRQAFDVIHLVRKLFSTFQNIIRIHHGRIIETSGDGFYAAFGFDRDAEYAVNAAITSGHAILKILDNLNARSFEKNLSQRIEVGIGVHVGKVATGNLHLGAKDHVLVLGYPVNVASRLQAATKDLNNNFIVSADAFRLLKNPPSEKEHLTVSLKGVSEPCELYLMGRAYRETSADDRQY